MKIKEAARLYAGATFRPGDAYDAREFQFKNKHALVADANGTWLVVDGPEFAVFEYSEIADEEPTVTEFSMAEIDAAAPEFNFNFS